MQIKVLVPWVMVVSRGLLGPTIVLGEALHWRGSILGAIVLAALLSDIFDGVLARRWCTDTPALRLSDSLADTVFYLGVATAIWFGLPAIWQQFRLGVLTVLSLEASRLAFDFAKFRKPASYHSYLAKAWGLVLAAAVVITFTAQRISLWMNAAILLGVLTNLESLAISVMLRSWVPDVKTVTVAWRLRAACLTEHRNLIRPARAIVSMVLIAVAILMCGRVAQGQSLQNVRYVGGTVLTGNGSQGKISIASADSLAWEGESKILIPYDHIVNYESASRKKVHLGLLSEGVWRLLAPWPESKQLSITYKDADDHRQVVVLDMSRPDEALLVEVLKARVTREISRPRPIGGGIPAAVVQEKAAAH